MRGVGSSVARLMAAGAGLVAVAIVAAVLVISLRSSQDIWSLLNALALGLFAALGFLAAFSWIAMSLRRRSPEPGTDSTADTVLPPLAALLDELEAARADTLRRVACRTLWRVPLGAAVALVATIYGEESDAFDHVSTVVMGGFGGYLWASWKLQDRYRRLYKERVLPVLAGRFGSITYRVATEPDMRRLRDEGIFGKFDRTVAEDELAGAYRGLPVSVLELTLLSGSGDDEKTNFDGLLVEVEMPRRLSGTTAIVADAGLLGTLREWLPGNGRRRVRLEDPDFERRYQVWGSDQIAARSLLTPAFMERFMALSERPGFGRPLALAADKRLLLAIPKSDGADYFEPPGYLKHAASKDALARLDRDLSAIFALVDAVFELDPERFWSA